MAPGTTAICPHGLRSLVEIMAMVLLALLLGSSSSSRRHPRLLVDSLDTDMERTEPMLPAWPLLVLQAWVFHLRLQVCLCTTALGVLLPRLRRLLMVPRLR